MSYTEFKWEIENVTVPDGSVIDKDTEIQIDVRVTNIGDAAGKDVVQLYFTPPYYRGGIEKPHVTLLDFAKTPTLEPGQSVPLSFVFTPYDMASYDCYDKNQNELYGWELDEGAYELKFMSDAHTKKGEGLSVTYNVDDLIRYRKDPETGGRIRNRFTGETAYADVPLDGSTLPNKSGEPWTYLSRADFKGTYPYETAADLTDGAITATMGQYQTDEYDNETAPVLGVDNGLLIAVKEDGSKATQAELNGEKGAIALKYNEELVFELGNPENWLSEKWDMVLAQLSIDDLKNLVQFAGYKTAAVESVGKPRCYDYDGPAGFNTSNMNPGNDIKRIGLPTENLIGQTFSKELAFNIGQVIGMDGQLFGNNGIYAPCVNLDRSIKSHRNYECFSEDPVLSGYLAAGYILGAKSNGVYCYLKHLVLYEPCMAYLSKKSFATEQNLRENYLRPFEIAIKKGGATAIMVSFNSVGSVYAGTNAALLKGVIKGEFGFKGTIITDYYTPGASSNINTALRAGLCTQLCPKDTIEASSTLDENDVSAVNCAVDAAKQILYTTCNAYWFAKNNDLEKSAYNVETSGPRVARMGFEWWILIVAFMNASVVAVLIWRVMVIFFPKKKRAAEGADSSSPSLNAMFASSAAADLPLPSGNRRDGSDKARKKPEADEAAETVDASRAESKTIAFAGTAERGVSIAEHERVVKENAELKAQIALLREELEAFTTLTNELKAERDKRLAAAQKRKDEAKSKPKEKRAPTAKQEIARIDSELSEIKRLLENSIQRDEK